MADSKEKALHKHVRIAPEQWERLEKAAQGTPHSPNQILVELAMEALDRREWPSTEVEIRVARAALFTAQAIALDPHRRRARKKRSRKSATSSRRSCPIRTPALRSPFIPVSILAPPRSRSCALSTQPPHHPRQPNREKSMRFLTGADIQRHVNKIVRRTGDVSAAVAYWGKGAAERTGIARKRNPGRVRVICDLLSGSCNPTEIETLLGLGVRVKTLNHLHAKVWISGDDVIIGSANASKSGLPRNNDSGAGGNIEAAVLSRDVSLSSELQGWFDNQWQASAIITEDNLADAARLWQRRNRADRRAFARTLIQKIRTPEPSDRFSGLRLVVYLAEAWSSEAEQFLKDKARTHYSGQEWAALKGEAPFYEWPGSYPEWTPGAQTALMDFSCAKKGGRLHLQRILGGTRLPLRTADQIQIDPPDTPARLQRAIPSRKGKKPSSRRGSSVSSWNVGPIPTISNSTSTWISSTSAKRNARC